MSLFHKILISFFFFLLIYVALLDSYSCPELSSVAGISRLDDQIFINRNPGVPSVVKFHPFNTCIAVADKDSIWLVAHITAHIHNMRLIKDGGYIMKTAVVFL